MRRVSLLLFMIACGPPPAPVADVPRNTPAHQPTAAELVQRAERANAEHLPLDYARPFERTPVADSPAVALYLDACRLGERSACWFAMDVAEQDAHVRSYVARSQEQVSQSWREAAKLVAANCVAGHHVSCLALPHGDRAHGMTFSSAPGAAGRSSACSEAEAPGCQETLLQQECDQGFARSCRVLADRISLTGLKTSQQNLMTKSVALIERAEQLEPETCRALLGEDCSRGSLPAARKSCELNGSCFTLAKLYIERGDTTHARDAAERGCQYFADSCAGLGVMYLDGVLPEPEPGRGQHLVDFICGSLRATNQRAFEIYKPCTRAKLPESP